MSATFNAKKLRITKYKLLAAILGVLTLILVINISAIAQGPTPTDDDVNRIAKQLYCPVCESTPLDVCPTEACRQWREVIRTMLAEGKTEEQIKQHFVTQYGVRVLNVPPNPWVTYAVPGVAILIGALMLLRGFQMWMKPLAAVTGPVDARPVHPDDYIARMEEELKKRN
jgi:cytochrome c-type biogenesis protein CcmH